MASLDGTITINSVEYRPCIINGEKALFHKWVDNELLILKFNTMLKKESIEQYRKMFEKTKIVPVNTTTEKVKVTLGLVEFENGSIKEVESTSIVFLDSGNLFYENAPFFRNGIERKQNEHKRPEPMIAEASQSNSVSAAAPLLRETMEIRVAGKKLTVYKDDIEKELYKSLDSGLGLQFGS